MIYNELNNRTKETPMLDERFYTMVKRVLMKLALKPFWVYQCQCGYECTHHTNMLNHLTLKGEHHVIGIKM